MPQIFWRTFQVRQFPVLFALLIALSSAASLARAQDNAISYIDPPTVDQGDAYRDAIAGDRIRADLNYVDETTRNLLDDNDTARPTEPVRERDGIYLPLGGSGFGVFFVVLFFVVLLFLFLKFGAGGTLMRGEPKDGSRKKTPTESWGLRPDDIPEGDLLSRIKAMSDRREALILLLRYCLLRAAEATDTHFRRADTEREALGRLPTNWPRFQQLRRLLMQTELVHYGGRDIDDNSYQSALNDGADILNAGGRNGR
ncbi:hypothetical protein SAMN04488515_0064 [Cognatiyoonia koreensis]|uniref:DUF4129 domain-containing protein n=1 Tax=Cognatiyoonia koreensis TaxID=364200 RepID=A0A1I0MKN7_9RHOB|nr:hypothetical protein [Cognatiyoonia koreensis]SEV88625.1 hypothetical protein SAMN04488515_0064 [Cognatiyoonia koreensis]